MLYGTKESVVFKYHMIYKKMYSATCTSRYVDTCVLYLHWIEYVSSLIGTC